MKVFSTIFLLTTIFIQTFSTYFIKAEFYLNQTYIAETLCVNRDKPMMHCNGKCYLSKKITEQQKKDHSPVSTTEKFDVQVYFLPVKIEVPTSFIILSKTTHLIQKPDLASAKVHSLFHPPAAVV
ncbi:MAG TPA: hypothetical protein VFF23_10765 [Hanamia sp.]|nr:hypothetical protein [Hanamia sp.]